MTFTFATTYLIHSASAAVLALAVLVTWLPSRKWMPVSAALAFLSSALLASEAAGRVVLLNRAPVVGGYENTLVVAAMVSLAASVLLVWAPPAARVLMGRLLLPWAAGALGFGLLFSAKPLVIGAEGRGVLAYAHALVGWADFTVLLVAAMAGVGLLLSKTEDAAVWQALLTRCLGAGFALLTATMASGSILSFAIYGSWYQWQTVEALAAALWIAYGVALHAFLLFGWRERRLAGLTVALLPLMLLTFWSWSLYSGTYHYFETLIRI